MADVHDLHATVNATTPPGMVRLDDRCHFERHVEERGLILGCFVDGELVAYGVLGLDSPTVDHMAHLLHLTESERERLCVLDGAATLPQWRGHHLHCRCIEERMALGRQLGRTLVAATVAPENLRSLRGLLKEGLVVRRYAQLYGGLARLVLQRDLLAAPQRRATRMQVEAGDHEGHQRALADGLQGYQLVQDSHGKAQRWLLEYGSVAS